MVKSGGTGFIGKHLSSVLKSSSYEVTIISRTPGLDKITWGEISTKGFPEGTKAIINLAGQNVMDFKKRWTTEFKKTVYDSRINTTNCLRNFIKNSAIKPDVFICMSGVGIYKPDKKKEYSESTPVQPFDYFSTLVNDWELSANMCKSDCRVITIRSGVVLGKEGGIIQQLYLPFMCGLGGPVGSGDQYFPWIHIEDLTRLIMFSVKTPEINGVVNAVAPQVTTNKEFTQAFASAMNRPALIPLPVSVLNIILSNERAKMLTEGQKVLSEKAQSHGFKFLFPDIRSACKDVI